MVWYNTQLTRLLNIKYPIIQAPMAGGATTASLVAASANAGGLGSLGAGYMSACDIKNAVSNIRALTNKPFAVNLFIPETPSVAEQEMEAACRAINNCIVSGLDFKVTPVAAPYAEVFAEQVQALLELAVPVFSFTFGLLDADLVEQFKAKQTVLIGTATTLAEALALQKIGVDAVVAQGSEAGGHRGSFLEHAEDSQVALGDLVGQLKSALGLPVIASGGIMTGHDIVKNMHAGAAAVQMGSAFLTCEESGASLAYKNKLFNQDTDNTTLTRAFSGKLARGIKNHFTQCMSKKGDRILPYPIQNKLTRGMRTHAKQADNTEYMSLWAGQSAYLARQLSVADLFQVLINEANTTDTEPAGSD